MLEGFGSGGRGGMSTGPCRGWGRCRAPRCGDAQGQLPPSLAHSGVFHPGASIPLSLPLPKRKQEQHLLPVPPGCLATGMLSDQDPPGQN